jgi:hypothetical protein
MAGETLDPPLYSRRCPSAKYNMSEEDANRWGRALVAVNIPIWIGALVFTLTRSWLVIPVLVFAAIAFGVWALRDIRNSP